MTEQIWADTTLSAEGKQIVQRKSAAGVGSGRTTSQERRYKTGRLCEGPPPEVDFEAPVANSSHIFRAPSASVMDARCPQGRLHGSWGGDHLRPLPVSAPALGHLPRGSISAGSAEVWNMVAFGKDCGYRPPGTPSHTTSRL